MCRSIKNNSFCLNPEPLVSNTEQRNKLMCTTETSILILINLNCQTWLIVHIELRPQNAILNVRLSKIPGHFTKRSLPHKGGKWNMYLLPASMTSSEKEKGPELKISQMNAPHPSRYLAIYSFIVKFL